MSDEGLQSRHRRTHDSEVDFESRPVCHRPTVPCLVFRVLGDEDEEVEPKDRNYDDAVLSKYKPDPS